MSDVQDPARIQADDSLPSRSARLTRSYQLLAFTSADLRLLPPTARGFLRTASFPCTIGAGSLADALGDHGVGDLDEAGDVRAHHVVALLAVLLGLLPRVVVNGLHDALELRIDFLAGPADAAGVLRHLEARGRDAAGVRGLARGVHDLRADELRDGARRRGHVRAFGDERAARLLEHERRVGSVELVLARAGEGAVVLRDELPRILAGRELDALALELAELAALDVFEVHHLREEILRDAVLDDDRAGAVREGDDLRAELHELLRREGGDVARARDDASLAFERLVALREHVLGEVDVAVAGRLGTDQRTAEGAALARKDARPDVFDALVLSEEVADLAAADVHVARRDVGVGADVAIELGHEALAEAHDFAVAAALARGMGALLRVEVRDALAAAHREGGEGVLEDLLEREELEGAELDRGVKAEAALVWTDRAVHLDAVAAVDADDALVVHPRNAEHDHALGFDHALENRVLFVLLVGLEHGIEGRQHLVNGLDELRLICVRGFYVLKDLINVFAHCFYFLD